MPRNADSRADCELTAELKARGLIGSTTRYERWRHAGLLPANDRRGAGRGRGSTSLFDLETVEIAAALARHTVQGRDLRISVIAWFLEADTKGFSHPEPPGPAVTPALAWAVRATTPYPLSQLVRAAVIAAQTEESHTPEPGEACGMSSPAVSLDLAAVREALLAGEAWLRSSSLYPSFFFLRVAEMCVGEPSLEVFAKAFADLLSRAALFPFLTSQQWRDAISDARVGACMGPFAALARHDPVIVLKDADIQQLRRARQTALNLAYYGETLNRRSLIRDPQKMAEWRAYLDMLGVGPSLRYLALLMTLPREAAVVIAACLDPVYSSLEKLLFEHYEQIVRVWVGRPLRPAGGEHDPVACLAIWPAVAPVSRPRQRAAGRRIGIGSYYRYRRRHAD